MARLDSLPFDLLHLIVALVGPHDLYAIALVCHSLNAVATPLLYTQIRCSHVLAKEWGKIVSPVELLGARPDLLAHVKVLDVRAVPLHKGAPNTQFTHACLHVVRAAPALAAFAWATAGQHSALLATILRHLADRAARPRLVRLALTDDSLSSADAPLLPRLGPVESVALHKPSSAAMSALAQWTCDPSPHLASLSLSANYGLDPPLLGRILANTPNLKSLSITNCLRITPEALFSIINAASLQLESLAFTILRDTDGDTLAATFPSLPTLRHITLSIDPPDEPIPDRKSSAPNDPLSQRLFRHIWTTINSVNLYSLTLRLASPRTLAPKLLSALITAHGDTLRRLNLFRLQIPATGVAHILRRVPNLEQLSVELGGTLDDLDLIIEALPSAQHLVTLIDTSPTISPSSVRRSSNAIRSRALIRVQATQLLQTGPALTNVVSQQRNWVKEFIWTLGRLESVVSMRKVRAL